MKPVPTIQDLVDPEKLHRNDQLKTLLNQPPPKQWVKTNKYANNSEYLSIEKVEYLMDKIFQEWKVEVLEYRTLFNSISVSVRLHYVNPLTGQWMYHDGVGAKELQTIAASGPLKQDFSNINKGAVEMALPIAKTSAIKDAADHLGKLFGRDLNRKDTLEYKQTYQRPEDSIVRAIKSATTITQLTQLKDICDTEALIEYWTAKNEELCK
jgi:hypothetical protein